MLPQAVVPARLVRCFCVARLALGLSALAGCTPVPILSEYAVTPEYSLDLLDAEVRGHDLKVEVHGSPFGVAPEAFAGQLAAEMNQAQAFAVNFTSHDTGKMAPGFKVVWDFAPAHELTPDEVCSSTDSDSAAASLPIDAYAALCRENKALSAVRAKLFYTGTQNSIEFIGLVDDVTRALFPTKLPAFRRLGDARVAPQLPHVAR